jgi:hypothetical protein
MLDCWHGFRGDGGDVCCYDYDVIFPTCRYDQTVPTLHHPFFIVSLAFSLKKRERKSTLIKDYFLTMTIN